MRSFFQCILAYVTVFFDERERSLLNPLRPLAYILGLALMPIVLIWHFLFNLLFPQIRLGLSYIRKTLNQLRSEKEIDVPPQTKFKAQWKGYHVPKTKLMVILNIEHVLLNVVDYMHHEDVVNLSLTCKAIRVAVYPPNDLEFRVPKLEKHCKSSHSDAVDSVKSFPHFCRSTCNSHFAGPYGYAVNPPEPAVLPQPRSYNSNISVD